MKYVSVLLLVFLFFSCNGTAVTYTDCSPIVSPLNLSVSSGDVVTISNCTIGRILITNATNISVAISNATFVSLGLQWVCVVLDGNVAALNMTILNSTVELGANQGIRLVSIGAAQFTPNGSCRLNISQVSFTMDYLTVDVSTGNLSVIGFGAYNATITPPFVNNISVSSSQFSILHSKLSATRGADVSLVRFQVIQLIDGARGMFHLDDVNFSISDCNVSAPLSALRLLSLASFAR